MISIREGLFFLICAMTTPSFAAEIFASNVGHYKIESCEYLIDEVVQNPDNMCSATEVDLAKDEKGILQLTLKKSAQENLVLPIEVYERIQAGQMSRAKYEEYGDFHIWTRFEETHQGDNTIVKIDHYVFDKGEESKSVSLLLSKSSFINGAKELSSSHRYKLIKQN